MVRIQQGSICIYRVFDIAEEINLKRAEELLSSGPKTGAVHSQLLWRLPKNVKRAFEMRSHHLLLELGQSMFRVGTQLLPAELTLRVRDYGVVTVLIEISIPPGTSWSDLVDMASELAEDDQVEEVAQTHAKQVQQLLGDSLKDSHPWTTYEDYVVYFFEKIDGIESAADLSQKADVAALILAETNQKEFAPATKAGILEYTFQYTVQDLAVIDWNSAIVIEPEGDREVLDLLELALTHLMEMRYYDDLLDKWLAQLYDDIEKSQGAKLRGDFVQLYKNTSTRFIEFSEFLERVENSLKVVGDFYLATIFRATARRFRLEDWQQNITRKMNLLAQISSLLQGEVNIRRSHWMELIVIMLIAFEILSALLKVF